MVRRTPGEPSEILFRFRRTQFVHPSALRPRPRSLTPSPGVRGVERSENVGVASGERSETASRLRTKVLMRRTIELWVRARMAESGKAHAWKACSRSGFWVQIPVLA